MRGDRSLVAVQLTVSYCSSARCASKACSGMERHRLGTGRLCGTLRRFRYARRADPLIEMGDQSCSLPKGVGICRAICSFALRSRSTVRWKRNSFPHRRKGLSNYRTKFLGLQSKLRLRILRFPALTPSGKRSPLLKGRGLLPKRRFRNVVGARTLRLHPMVMATTRNFVARFCRILISSFNRGFECVLRG